MRRANFARGITESGCPKARSMICTPTSRLLPSSCFLDTAGLRQRPAGTLRQGGEGLHRSVVHRRQRHFLRDRNGAWSPGSEQCLFRARAPMPTQVATACNSSLSQSLQLVSQGRDSSGSFLPGSGEKCGDSRPLEDLRIS